MARTVKVGEGLLTKQLVAFTWDDNSLNHNCIASIFESFGTYCTFYINPGHDDFFVYSDMYKQLAVRGHEIGNHGLHHISYLDKNPSFIHEELIKSQHLIAQLTGKRPYTMAFPFHYYSEKEVLIAKKTHIETRNTLDGSVRLSLNTKSNMDLLIKLIAEEKRNIIFSGHSVNDDGYEPISVTFLYDLVGWIKSQKEMYVSTFLFAATMRMLICHGSRVEGNHINVSEKAEQELFHLNADIEELLQ